MISPITYFYTIVKPGKFCYVLLILYVLHGLINVFSYFSGTLDKDFIRQWQRTLLIFNGILVVVNVAWVYLDLTEEDQDWTLTIIGFSCFSLIAAGLIKTYIEEFVNLSKI